MKYSALWQITGNLLSAVSLWVGVVTLTRVTTPMEVGSFAYAMSITAPIYLFFNLRLRLVLSTDASNEYTHGQYILLRVITSCIALLLIVLFVFSYVDEVALGYIIMIVAIAKFIGGIGDIFYGLFQSTSQSDLVGKSLMLKSIITILVSTLLIILLESAVGLGLGMLISWLVILLFYDIQKIRSMNLSIHKACTLVPLKRLFYSSLPLAFVALISSITTNMPRYYIQHYLGSSDLGIYAAIAYFSSAAALFAAGLGQPKLKQLADSLHEGNIANFRINLYKLIAIGSISGSLGVLVSCCFGSELLLGFYGEEYQKYEKLFILIMIASTLTMVALFQWYAMTALKAYKHQLYIAIFSLLLSPLLLFTLLKEYNLEGAAIAEIAILFFQTVIFFIIIERKLHAYNSIQ